MDSLDHAVRRAAWRIGFNRTLRVLCWTCIAVGALLCLRLLVGKLFLIGALADYLTAALAAACLACGVVLSGRRWPEQRAAALRIDERLNLGERVSSALAVRDRRGAMPHAVVEDARAFVRNAPMSEAFPVRLRREAWGVLGVAGLAFALMQWMPQYDLLSQRVKQEKALAERKAVQEEGKRLHETISRMQEEAKRSNLKNMEMRLEKMEDIARQMESGALKREDAMAKLGDLSEMLREARAGAPKDNPLAQALADRQGLEMTRDVAKSLAAKDYTAAGKALKDLADAAAQGDLTKEQKDKLEKELQKLAKALGDPGDSGDQKDLADALKSLSQALSEEDMAALQKALAQCEGDLAQMEAELRMLQAAAKMCEGGKNGLGDPFATWDGANPFQPGDNRDLGPGLGGPGLGVGGVAQEQPTDVDFSPTRVHGHIQPGRVLGSFFVNGREVKGEAKAEYVQAVDAARAEAAQAMTDQKVPRAYETYVRDYFQSMKDK